MKHKPNEPPTQWHNINDERTWEKQVEWETTNPLITKQCSAYWSSQNKTYAYLYCGPDKGYYGLTTFIGLSTQRSMSSTVDVKCIRQEDDNHE